MNWIPSGEEVTYYTTLSGSKTSSAEFYKVMLPLMLEKVNEDYNQNFVHTDLPANVKLFLAKAVQFYAGNSGVKGRSMGTVSYSYDFSQLPKSITDLLRKYRKVKFHALR